MMRLGIVGVVVSILLLLGISVSADELYTVDVYNSGVVKCNTGNHEAWIPNPTYRSIRIRAVETWMGMSEHGVADFWAHSYAVSLSTGRWTALHKLGWDHYAEPVAPSNLRKSFAPDWITLAPGDYVYVVVGCSGYQNISGHVLVMIEYTVAP